MLPSRRYDFIWVGATIYLCDAEMYSKEWSEFMTSDMVLTEYDRKHLIRGFIIGDDVCLYEEEQNRINLDNVPVGLVLKTAYVATMFDAGDEVHIHNGVKVEGEQWQMGAEFLVLKASSVQTQLVNLVWDNVEMP